LPGDRHRVSENASTTEPARCSPSTPKIRFLTTPDVK
jgi:hypothetical protein